MERRFKTRQGREQLNMLDEKECRKLIQALQDNDRVDVTIKVLPIVPGNILAIICASFLMQVFLTVCLVQNWQQLSRLLSR